MKWLLVLALAGCTVSTPPARPVAVRTVIVPYVTPPINSEARAMLKAATRHALAEDAAPDDIRKTTVLVNGMQEAVARWQTHRTRANQEAALDAIYRVRKLVKEK